jgi:hypothetical protein
MFKIMSLSFIAILFLGACTSPSKHECREKPPEDDRTIYLSDKFRGCPQGGTEKGTFCLSDEELAKLDTFDSFKAKLECVF